MSSRKCRGSAPLFLAGVCAMAPATALAQTRPFTAEDMLDLVQISGAISVASGGDRVAYMLPDGLARRAVRAVGFPIHKLRASGDRRRTPGDVDGPRP